MFRPPHVCKDGGGLTYTEKGKALTPVLEGSFTCPYQKTHLWFCPTLVLLDYPPPRESRVGLTSVALQRCQQWNITNVHCVSSALTTERTPHPCVVTNHPSAAQHHHHPDTSERESGRETQRVSGRPQTTNRPLFSSLFLSWPFFLGPENQKPPALHNIGLQHTAWGGSEWGGTETSNTTLLPAFSTWHSFTGWGLSLQLHLWCWL